MDRNSESIVKVLVENTEEENTPTDMDHIRIIEDQEMIKSIINTTIRMTTKKIHWTVRLSLWESWLL